MAEGFVIFRDPETGETHGWKGDYSAFKPDSGFGDFQFFVQPWDSTTRPQVLTAKKISAGLEESLDWVKTMNLYPSGPMRDIGFEEYVSHVGFIKTGIAQGDFEKVVASRSETFQNKGVNFKEIFQKLCISYPGAMVYMVYHPGWGCWMGATPEKLLIFNQGYASITALAGTLYHENQNWSDKEKYEQSIIEKFILEILEKRGIQILEKSTAREVRQGAMAHLHSKITFPSSIPDLGDLLAAIHPSPAVCGYPQKESMMFIDRFENLERELFTGWLGWCIDGKFNSWVNLRCARIYRDFVRVFAGCGINSLSVAESEWLESEAKMKIIGDFIKAG